MARADHIDCGEGNSPGWDQLQLMPMKKHPPIGGCCLHLFERMASALRLSLAHGDAASHPFNVLQIVDRGGFIRLIRQVDEGEATLAAGLTIQGHGALAHFAVLGE